MVRKTHCYADGGKVIKDHTAEKPSFTDAVVDRVKGMFNSSPKVPKLPKKTSASGNRNEEQQMKDLDLADGGKVKRKC